MTTRKLTTTEITTAMKRRNARKRREAYARGEVRASQPKRSGPPGVGDVLVDLLRERYKIGGCQQCHDLAAKMNTWGPEGCREHMEEIVQSMWDRRKGLTGWRGKLVAMASATAITDAIAEAAGKAELRKLVEEAIEIVESRAAG